MMAPDYTHWHGTYDLAKHWYTKFIPELEEMVEKGKASGDPKKVAAADTLAAKIEEILNSENHKWFLDKLDPEEKARRDKARAEFKARYK